MQLKAKLSGNVFHEMIKPETTAREVIPFIVARTYCKRRFDETREARYEEGTRERGERESARERDVQNESERKV